MKIEWKPLIVQMVLIKQEMAKYDKAGLWEYHLPGVAASEERLLAVEARLGQPLDPSYRSFLQHADGWPAFYQTVSLFGVDDLLGSSRFKQATSMVGFLEDEALRKSGLSRRELLPIAATTEDLDLFVLVRKEGRAAGSVVWFAGGEIDRFPSFEEYFRAMLDYNRAGLQDLIGKVH